jgi:hypothetical protein
MSVQEIVQRAFDASPALMVSFRDFIQYTDIEINNEFADRYFNNMRNCTKIYVSDVDINYLGYGGELRKNRYNFINAAEKKTFGYMIIKIISPFIMKLQKN